MINFKIIRLLDLTLSCILLLLLLPINIILLMICFLESGKPIFIQERIGKNQKIFKLIKFRTMELNTPSLASHLIKKDSVTKFGLVIRLLKLDEFPQLINVIKGEMSLVGPRPCLPNQKELINERQKHNIFRYKPGITGLAQINGIDMSNPQTLTNYDKEMIKNFNTFNYFKYLILTIIGKGRGDKVSY